MSAAHTVVAILTPPGRGAVATIAVRGPQAIDIVGQRFTPASKLRLSDLPLGRVQFGTFRGIDGGEEESVVVAIGPNEIEIHGHGGVAATGAIVRSLVAAGATEVPWQTWSAEIDGPIQAECRIALAGARTERVCAILLDQYRGALERELESIDALLAGAQESEQLDARQRLERLLNLFDTLGSHLTHPWRIVLTGEPNVGKSSLLNALLGYERSIVFDQPGTTRDALRAITAIDGWPVELCDTAGLRSPADPLEADGLARASEQLATADCVLHVTDASQPATIEPRQGAILVGNKSDLIDAPARAAWQRRHPNGILVSAKTGPGIDDLCRVLSGRLVPAPPLSGQAVPFTPRQRDLVAKRYRDLRQDGNPDQSIDGIE